MSLKREKELELFHKNISKEEAIKYYRKEVRGFAILAFFLYLCIIVIVLAGAITIDKINENTIQTDGVMDVVDSYCRHADLGAGLNIEIYDSYVDVVCEKNNIRIWTET